MRLTGALDYLTGALTCRSHPTCCGASIGGGARRFLIVAIAYFYFFCFEIIHIQICISDYSSLCIKI
jgi:hypothetical protein